MGVVGRSYGGLVLWRTLDQLALSRTNAIGGTLTVNGVDVPQAMVYSGEILNAAMIFKVLMLAFVPMSLVHVFGTYVTATGNMKWLATLAFVCVGVNVVFNFLKYRRWVLWVLQRAV